MASALNQIAKYRAGWKSGLPETSCGNGSRLEQTKIQRKWLPRMVRKYGIDSVVDIGAGDLNWIRQIDWSVKYTALDLVPRHSSVEAFDILAQIPPRADMALCLWVLNHMPNETALLALSNILRSQPRYFVYSWWPAMSADLDLGYDERIVVRPSKKAELRLLQIC